MKRLIVSLSFIFILFITGCQTKTMGPITQLCEDVDGLTLLNKVSKVKDGEEVKVCGVVTSWAGEDRIFIQDDTSGIYVYGNKLLGNVITNQQVGHVVTFKAQKGTYKGNVQLRFLMDGNLQFIKNGNDRPFATLVNASQLEKHRNKLVQIQNVSINLDEEGPVLYDNQGNRMASIWSSFTVPEYDDVNIIGVYYQTDEDRVFAISDLGDIRLNYDENSSFYEIPTTFEYDGPDFPQEALNKSFFEGERGGLMKVELKRCTDGDTALFDYNVSHTNGTGTRFFNIDTQESTKEKEEWGKPASIYTCNLLSGAEEIYLQSDPGDGPLDKYDRLLGWVWVDGELLQYHLTRLGLAEVKYLYGADMYTEALLDAQNKARDEGLAQWGDLLDPYWDYEHNAPKGW